MKSTANVTNFGTLIKTTAPDAQTAYFALLDEMGKAGGDWEVKGPYGVGILNGQIVTGQGYEARKVCKVQE